jgi:hypothetical protein
MQESLASLDAATCLVTLWPNVVRRVIVPPDVDALLLTDLERAE